MDREIKFRGQRVDTKEWVYGSLLTGFFLRGGQDVPYIMTVDGTDYDCFEDFSEENGLYEVITETVGQYTGLKDKNGNEIYEGNIIKGFIPEIANEPERIGIVKWGSYGWIIDFELPKYESGIGVVGFCSFHNYEVIGNIHENPELLDRDGE